jgi:tape measure domain-containing protein
MAEQIAVELRVKTAQLANDLRKANAQIAALKKNTLELGNTGAKAFNQLSQSANKATKSLSGIATVLRAVAVYSAGQAILGNLKTWSEYISAIQAANNQLKSLGGTSQDLARIQAATLQIANETGSAYNETAVTVARLSRAIEEFGGTTDQALIITDSLNKALLLTGATGAEATSTLIQFSQALQSGILQGDELRSLRENAPAVIRAIADEMGIATSQIKKAGEEGKITADIVAKALIKANADLTAGVADIPLTIGRSIQVASNNIADFVTNSQAITGFIEDLSAAIFDASNLLLIFADDMTTYGEATDQANQSTEGAISLVDAFAIALGGPIKAFYTLGKVAKLVLDLIANALKAIVLSITEVLSGLAQTAQGLGSAVGSALVGDFDAAERQIREAAGGVENIYASLAKNGQQFLIDSGKDFTEFADGVSAAWLNTARTVERVKLDGSGDLRKPPADPEKGTVTKEDTKAVDEYTRALQALQATQLSLSSASEQARAEFDAVGLAIENFRVLAANAGQTVDEEFIQRLQELSLQKVERTLDDLQVAWIDISTALDETGLKLKEQNDLWLQFVAAGTAAGKTMDEIKVAFDKFNKDTQLNANMQELKDLSKDVGDAFQDAAESIIFDSENASDALKNLAKEVGKLVLQFLILKAVQALTGAAGGGAGGVGGVMPQSAGPQVRVFNYGAAPGGVQTRGNSSGGVDVIIGQVAAAIGRGGNPLDTALRRTYGIGRQGR